MRNVILALLLGASIPVCAQAPLFPTTGNIGPGGLFGFRNADPVSMTDTNLNLTYPATSAGFVKVTSSVSLTTTRNLVEPFLSNAQCFENLTTGGQSIQIIGLSGSGVVIANGTYACVQGDGTNYVTGSSGGGSSFITSITTTGTSGPATVVSGVLNVPQYSGTSGISQLTGDVTAGPGSGSQVATLATVNSNVGTFGDATHTVTATMNAKGLTTAISSNAIPTAAPGTNGLSSPDNSTITATAGVYKTANTTINSQTCTPGGSCTIPLAVTTYEFQPAAIGIGGSAYAAKLSYYDNNPPALGPYNTSQSTQAYLQFDPMGTAEYAQGSTAYPPNWTHTDAYVTFSGTVNTGNVTWEIQTACVGTGGTAGAEGWSTGVSVTTAFPGTVGQYVVTAIFSNVAASGANSCPTTPTTPGQIAYRITRTDSTTGEAQVEGVTLATARSQ